MKLLKFVLLILPLCSMYAQKYELGNVTAAELQQARHPADSSAAAAILFSKATSYMSYNESTGFFVITEVEAKIKVYTKDGYKWGTKEVSLYNGSTEKETVSFSKAVTYNLVNGQVVKSKLKSDGEFSQQRTKNRSTKKIILPEVKEGSIIEYKYTLRSPFVSVLPDWMFQEEIPVNHSEYTTKIPEYFVFNPVLRGFYSPAINSKKEHKSMPYFYKQRAEGVVVKESTTRGMLEYEEETRTYTLDNLPALKEESYAGNIKNYAAGIEHELSMTKYPGDQVKSYSNSWEDVAATIYKFDSFGGELKKTGYFEDDISVLLQGLTTPAEKINALFTYVKSRMHWNDVCRYDCEAGVKKAYNEKVGGVAEINLMLTAMLRYAGLDANPVLLSTRSQKVALFPALGAFNYVICGVKVGDKTVLLDATSKWALPDVLPLRTIGWSGRLIKNDGTSEIVNLAPQTVSKEVVNLALKIEAGGKCTGKARDQYFDQNAAEFRENYTLIGADAYAAAMEKHYPGLEVGTYKVTNDKDTAKPVFEEYDFTVNAVEAIGDKLYFSPMVFFAETENPFTTEKREYPIDFIFPQQDKYMITISLPQGYTVASLPERLAMSMEKNIGSFNYSLQQQGNSIQAMVLFDINYALVPAGYYDTVKNFFRKIMEKQNEKIVLKKS